MKIYKFNRIIIMLIVISFIFSSTCSFAFASEDNERLTVLQVSQSEEIIVESVIDTEFMPNTDIESDTEVEPNSDAEIDSELNSESDEDTESVDLPDTDSNIDTDTDSSNSTDTDTELPDGVISVESYLTVFGSQAKMYTCITDYPNGGKYYVVQKLQMKSGSSWTTIKSYSCYMSKNVSDFVNIAKGLSEGTYRVQSVVCLDKSVSKNSQEDYIRKYAKVDINGDITIDIVDVILMRSHIIGINVIKNAVVYNAADYNSDGQIDVLDVVKLRNGIINH